MGTDAKVTVGVDGSEEVARAADRAMRPWTAAANSAKGAMQSMGTAITDTFRQATSDIARGVTAFAAFDFGSKLPAVISYREEVARLSVVAGQSSEQLRQRFAAQEAATLSARSENEKFAQSFGRLTYNYKEATTAADALANEALAANRSIAELSGVGKVVLDAVGSIQHAPEVFERIRAQAAALKTTGGPDALRDQLESLSGVMARVAATSPEQLGKVTGMLGALGKGLRPDQAREVQQTLLGDMMGDTRKTERFLRSQGELGRGESILDEHGQIKAGTLPEVFAKFRRAWRKGAGSEQEAARLARMRFGDMAGAAFMGYSPEEAAKLGGLGPSGEAAAAAESLRQSDEGQRKLKQIQASGAQQDVAAEALPAVDSVLGFAKDHPILAGIGALVGPGLVAKGGSWAARAAMQALFGGGGGAAVGGGGAALGGGGAAAGGTAALDAAAAGGWLPTTGLGGSALLGLAAGGAMVTASALANAKVLTEIGEDTDTTGRKWRDANGGVVTLEAYSKARRAEMKQEEDMPYDVIAYRAERNAIGAGASKDDAKEIGRLIAEEFAVKAQITVINQTGGPIQVVTNQSGGNASGHQ